MMNNQTFTKISLKIFLFLIGFWSFLLNINNVSANYTYENNNYTDYRYVEYYNYDDLYRLKHYVLYSDNTRNVGRTELYKNGNLIDYVDTVFFATGSEYVYGDMIGTQRYSKIKQIIKNEDKIEIYYEYRGANGMLEYVNKNIFYIGGKKEIDDFSSSISVFGSKGKHFLVKLNLKSNGEIISSKSYYDSLWETGAATIRGWVWPSVYYGTNGCSFLGIENNETEYKINYKCIVTTIITGSSAGGPGSTTYRDIFPYFILPKEEYSLCNYNEEYCEQQPIQIPTPTNLKQYIQSPYIEKREEIQVGSKIGKFQSGSGVIFETEIDNPESKEFKIEVQIYEKLSGNTRTLKSGIINSSGKKIFTIPLEAGDYTWKLRLEDTDGNTSEWKEFGNNGTDIDFSIFEGFEPYPYGFSFVNTSPISGLLTGGIKNVPNENSYINFSIEPGPKQEIFDALFPITYFKNENERIAAFISYGFNEKDPSIFYIGNCHGLSLISTTYKKYPLKIKEVSNKFYNIIGAGTIYDNISLSAIKETDGKYRWNKYDEILKTILFFQYLQNHTNYTITSNYYVKNKNPIDILNELKENPDKLYILSFGGAKTENYEVKGHAVVPYRVEGNRIYIWDNNVPYPNYGYEGITYNAYEQYIEVYGNGKNDFKIKLYNDEAFGFNYFSDMSIVDLETIYGETENKAMGFNNNDTLYTLSGNSELVLKDDLGRISGYKDGKIYEEIPGTIFVRNYGITLDTINKENTWKQIYLPQKLENLTIEINGKIDENYDLMIAGGDYYTKLEGITTSSGQTDTFNISRENIKLDFDNNKILNNNYNLLSYDFQNNSTGSLYLHQLEIIKEKQSLDIDWGKVINNTENSISYFIDLDNDGIYDIESSFNSLPKSENENGSISGYLKGINSPGNSNMAGWKIYLDSNNDGKLQENKELFVVTDNKGYYEFKDLEKGNYSIRVVMKPNWEQIKPNNNYYNVKLNNGQNIVNLSFENKFLKGNNKK